MLGWLLRLLLLFLLVRALMLIVGGLIRGLIGAAQVPGEPRQGAGAGCGRPVRTERWCRIRSAAPTSCRSGRWP